MKVIYVNLESNIGGSEQSLVLLIQNLCSFTGVAVACPKGKLFTKLTNMCPTYTIPSAPKFKNLFIWGIYLFFVNFQLLLITLKFKPDIIHANSSKALLVSILAGTVMRVKIIWHARDTKYHKFFIRFSRLLGFRVISVSKTVENTLIKAGLQADKIEVVHNGVSIDRTHPEVKSKKEELRIFTFAHVGQFVPWKNHCLYIKAAERFIADGGRAEFLIVGEDLFGRDNKYNQWLSNRIKTSSIEPKIRLTGWMEELEQFWPKIDCLVHTANFEPFGRVVIEAMSNGVPVIAPANGGPSEIITHKKTGLLFKPDSINDLTLAMKSMSSNKDITNKMRENARNHIIENFRAKDTAEKTCCIYKKMTA